MGCHFCTDELFAVMTILGGAKYLPGWIKAVWARRHRKPVCHHDHEHGGA